MDFDRDEVLPDRQRVRGDVDGLEGRIDDSGGREGVLIDGAVCHAGAEQFRAVEVDNRAVVDEELESELVVRGVSGVFEGCAKVVSHRSKGQSGADRLRKGGRLQTEDRLSRGPRAVVEGVGHPIHARERPRLLESPGGVDGKHGLIGVGGRRPLDWEGWPRVIHDLVDDDDIFEVERVGLSGSWGVGREGSGLNGVGNAPALQLIRHSHPVPYLRSPGEVR